MQRRSFLGALGTATGTSLAGCSDVDLENRTPPDDPVERIRFLERERALLLYLVGAKQVNRAEAAAEHVQTNYDTAKTLPEDLLRATFFHGHVAAAYDAASTCFEFAGRILDGLEDLPLDAPVDACSEAQRLAEHRSRAHVHLANVFVDRDVGVEGETTATPTPTEYSGMEPAGRTEDDDSGGMQVANPQEGFHHSGVDDQQVLADDHFEAVKGFSVQPVGELQQQLGLDEE